MSENNETDGTLAGMMPLPHSTRAFRLLPMLALAVLALAASAAPVAAQTLVSNFGQASNGSRNMSAADFAQGFTTGSSTGGYTLTSVKVRLITPAGVTVKIATGLPSATNVVATLNNPALSGTDDYTFTAPASTTLSASTTYFVVVEASSGELSFTNSTDDDTGGATGWSVADSALVRLSSSWSAETGPSRIQVNGTETAASPPGQPNTPTLAPGPTSGTLAVNWAAPTSESAITDYDLRYFKGSNGPELRVALGDGGRAGPAGPGDGVDGHDPGSSGEHGVPGAGARGERERRGPVVDLGAPRRTATGADGTNRGPKAEAASTCAEIDVPARANRHFPSVRRP